MREYFNSLFQNASLSDFLAIGGGIITVVTLLYKVVTFLYKYHHRYGGVRKEYLNKINVAYNLVQDCNTVIYDVNRYTDAVNYVQKIEQSIIEIEHYHRNHQKELEEFDQAYVKLTSSWDVGLNLQWQHWCDFAKGNAYINGVRNWDVFSVKKFWSFYDSLKPMLNLLRKQVYESI